MKIAVYTAITASKDSLKKLCDSAEIDLVLFSDQLCTDQLCTEPDWNVRPACTIFADPRRNARAHKLLAHQYLPDYDYSLWIDGSICLLVPPRDLIKMYLDKADIALFPHPCRDCIYEEAAACADLDDPAVIAAQMAKYKQEHYPKHNGLNATGVILRRHNARTEAFNNAWWSELCRYSLRDQLSFNYVLHKLDIRAASFPGHVFANPGLTSYEGHLK